MNCQLDHLVVAAASLEQAVRWCEVTLGVTPGPGGRHPLMGTHNRLVNLSAPGFERCYLELIAVDPEAPSPGRPRWFGLDEPALQATLAQQGPRLIHAVLRSPNIEMMRWGLINKGADPGPMLAAERSIPGGTLRWRILVRDDGALPGGGALPTLIDWQGAHPTDTLPASPVTLQELQAAALPAGPAQVLRWRGPVWRHEAGAPVLRARLSTPVGEVWV